MLAVNSSFSIFAYVLGAVEKATGYWACTTATCIGNFVRCIVCDSRVHNGSTLGNGHPAAYLFTSLACGTSLLALPAQIPQIKSVTTTFTHIYYMNCVLFIIVNENSCCAKLSAGFGPDLFTICLCLCLYLRQKRCSKLRVAFCTGIALLNFRC